MQGSLQNICKTNYYYETLQGEKKVLAAEHHHLMLDSPKPNLGEIYTKHCDAQKSTMTEVGKTYMILLSSYYKTLLCSTSLKPNYAKSCTNTTNEMLFQDTRSTFEESYFTMHDIVPA